MMTYLKQTLRVKAWASLIAITLMIGVPVRLVSADVTAGDGRLQINDHVIQSHTNKRTQTQQKQGAKAAQEVPDIFQDQYNHKANDQLKDRNDLGNSAKEDAFQTASKATSTTEKDNRQIVKKVFATKTSVKTSSAATYDDTTAVPWVKWSLIVGALIVFALAGWFGGLLIRRLLKWYQGTRQRK